MRKSVLNLAVLVVALLSTIAINVNAQKQISSEYLYNTKMENGKVITKSICKLNENTGLYDQHILYKYTYTDNEMMESRITYRWDKNTGSWEVANKMNYEYDELTHTTTIKYAVWNQETETFDEPISKAVYQTLSDHLVTSYSRYEKENVDANWTIKEYFNLDNNIASLTQR